MAISKRRAKKDPPKEEVIPKKCVCGRPGILVVWKGKKKVSCPDPKNCSGNFQTGWFGSKEQAIANWNSLIMK